MTLGAATIRPNDLGLFTRAMGVQGLLSGAATTAPVPMFAGQPLPLGQTDMTAAAARFTQPLSRSVSQVVLDLRMALGEADRELAGLRSATEASAAQAQIVERVWVTLAQLDRALDVAAAKGVTRIDEIQRDMAKAEGLLADLGLKPMSQWALQLYEGNMRFYLQAPGQANEYINLLRTIYERSPMARRFLDEIVAPTLESSEINIDFHQLMSMPDSPETRAYLSNSRVSQPLIFATQLAMLEELKTYGFNPRRYTAGSGHSQGLLVSVVASGMISPADALRIVALHGRSMDASDPAVKGKISMVGVLGVSREELCGLSVDISLHFAMLNGIPGICEGATREQLARVSKAAKLYGQLIPVRTLAKDESLRRAIPFLQMVYDGAFSRSEGEMEADGLPQGVREIGKIIGHTAPGVESLYPTLANIESLDGSRTQGVHPAINLSGTTEALLALLSILGNKQLKKEPHAAFQWAGYQFDETDPSKDGVTAFPKTLVIDTVSSSFHHQGRMRTGLEASVASEQHPMGQGFFPVVLNSEPKTLEELEGESGAPLSVEERARRVKAEQHTRQVLWARAVERLLTFGDPEAPAVFLDLAPGGVVAGFTETILAGRGRVLSAEKHYDLLTSRRASSVALPTPSEEDPELYAPILPQVLAGPSRVKGRYLGPAAYLSRRRLGVDSDRHDLIGRIERVLDFSNPEQPTWRFDGFLTAMGASGPMGMAAMTGPGSSKLVGAVARHERTAFLAAGNYPPRDDLGVSTRMAFFAGLVDTAWETTRGLDARTGLPVDDGHLTHNGEAVVRGSVEDYADRARTDDRFLAGRFAGPMKPFGVNVMHGMAAYAIPQLQAVVDAIDRGIPVDKLTLGIYLVSDLNKDLNRYIPLLARGVRYIPLLPNLQAIATYEGEHIPHLKAQLKKYFEGGWETFDQENRDPQGNPIYSPESHVHQKLREEHPEYFGPNGYDKFMADHPHLFGEAREGNDGGGHNDPKGTPTRVLMEHAWRRGQQAPNLATGGYASGKLIADALLAGASGTQTGSLYEITAEADLPDSVKHLLMQVANPSHPRGNRFIVSEFGKTIQVADNEFSRAYEELVATVDPETILQILEREPASSVTTHREYWDNGIDVEDGALGAVRGIEDWFAPLWSYLQGDRSSGRAAALEAVGRIVKRDEANSRKKFVEEQAKKEEKDRRPFDPLKDNNKVALIVYFRVFRTNMVQRGEVDPEWAYVLAGPSMTLMSEALFRIYSEEGRFPSVKEMVEIVEGEAKQFLVDLYWQAREIEERRAHRFNRDTFERLPHVEVESREIEGGAVTHIQVTTRTGVDAQAFREVAKAQGYGDVARVFRSNEIFDRFLTPANGRQFIFEVDRTDPKHPELLSVTVYDNGRKAAELRKGSPESGAGDVLLTAFIPLSPTRPEPAREIHYHFRKVSQHGTVAFQLDVAALQLETMGLFGELLTGKVVDHAGKAVTDHYTGDVDVPEDKALRYNKVVGEGYPVFQAVGGRGRVTVHPGLAGVFALNGAVDASTHPELRANRFELLHGYVDEVFGAPLQTGDSLSYEAQNTGTQGLDKGGFAQDARVLLRRQGRVIGQFDTGFVNLDPASSFPRPETFGAVEKMEGGVRPDNGRQTYTGFAEFPIFQASTKVTRQDIQDYGEFDPNAIHHWKYVAQLMGLDEGEIAQGMLVRAKMQSHFLGGYLKGDLKRAVSVRTEFRGKVKPGEDLDLYGYKVGQKGDEDIIRFDAVNSAGQVVVSQTWVVKRVHQTLAFPGQGFQEAGLWDKVLARYQAPANAPETVQEAYRRARKAMESFIAEVDKMSEAEWGFKLSNVVKHAPKTLSYSVKTDGDRGHKAGERVTLINPGDKGVLSETDIAQPALTVAYLLDEIGLGEMGLIDPNADVVYNSLGKIPALAAIGAISRLDAVRVARARGRFMAAVSGAFGVVSLKKVPNGGLWAMVEQEAAAIREEMGADYGVWATNNNSSLQAGFAGTEKGVTELIRRLNAKGALDLKDSEMKAQRLGVIKNPFHTSLYQGPAEEFYQFLQGIVIDERHLGRLVLNSTGRRFQPGTDDIRRTLANHIAQPIRVEADFEVIAKGHPEGEVLEMGPVAELSKRLRETAKAKGLKGPARVLSAADAMAKITHAEPDTKIELKPRVKPEVASAPPSQGASAGQAQPAAASVSAPAPSSGMDTSQFRYVDAPAPGSAEFTQMMELIRALTMSLSFVRPGLYGELRKGLLATDDAATIDAIVENIIKPLGPGAIEGLKLEVQRRKEAMGSMDAAGVKIQEFIVNVLEAGCRKLAEIKKKLEEASGKGGVDVDSREFKQGVIKTVIEAADAIGYVRYPGTLQGERMEVVEVTADGTVVKAGGLETTRLRAEQARIEATTTPMFRQMLASDYRGRRLTFNKIEHNGAEDNLLAVAATIRAAEEGSVLDLSQRRIAVMRRRLANQLDDDGRRRAEVLAKKYGEEGLTLSAQFFQELARETEESIRVGGLPPLHDFDMTEFDPRYGTAARVAEVTRGMSPEQGIDYLESNGFIDKALADRMRAMVQGKKHLKDVRALFISAGGINTALLSFLLEHGAQVTVTTTRPVRDVQDEFNEIWMEHGARGASLEIKSEFGLNSVNYVKLRDELRLQGFAPNLLVNGAAVEDYGPFKDVSREDWHAASEALVRSERYILRLLAGWYLEEDNGVTVTVLHWGSPAARAPMKGSGTSYQTGKEATNHDDEVLDHIVAAEQLRYSDGTPFAVGKVLEVGFTPPPMSVTRGLMVGQRYNAKALVAEIQRKHSVGLHIFDTATIATCAAALLDPDHRGESERAEALGNFTHPALAGGELDRNMEEVGKAEEERHKVARKGLPDGKYLTEIEALRRMDRTDEAKRLEAAEQAKKREAAAHPFQFGQLYRVWQMPFYIRDERRALDTFDPERHIEAHPEDMVALTAGGTSGYGRTLIGSYRNALARREEFGPWGGADWQALIKGLPGIPQDLTAEQYESGVAPDGKRWKDKIFAQAGLRQLEHFVHHKRRDSSKLDKDALIPVAASNKALLRRHRERGHEVILHKGYDVETGEWVERYFVKIPKGEEMMSWVVDSLNVTTLADLPGGSDNFFATLTGVPGSDMGIKAYATVLSRLTVSDLLRMLGMNATDLRNELTAAAIKVVAGIGMTDFNPAHELLVGPTESDTTPKDAIIKAIPNAIDAPSTDQVGAADGSIVVSAACATGPAALKGARDDYEAAYADMRRAEARFTMGQITATDLFIAAQKYYMRLFLTWSVDHANTAANVQGFDALGERGAMARDDFYQKLGVGPDRALASHNEDADGFLAGVMVGSIGWGSEYLAKKLGLKPLGRMVTVSESTDFAPDIRPGEPPRENTAPGVEGQVLALTRLMRAIINSGYTLEDIVAWFTHSTGTMGDGKQSTALRMALEISEAADPGMAIEVFAKQIFGHGLGATMFEQCMALVVLHSGITLGQPSLVRLIQSTAENPYMFPTRIPRDLFAVFGKSARRVVAGTNFGFHGENRAWAIQAASRGFNNLEEAIASLTRTVRNEAQSIADTIANRNGKQDDVVQPHTAHAPLETHPQAKFMWDHAQTIALMMIEAEVHGARFDFDGNLETEVLAYEAAVLRTTQGPTVRLTLAQRRALAAKGDRAYQPHVDLFRRLDEETPAETTARRAYAKWGEGFAELAEDLAIRSDFVAEFLDNYRSLMKRVGAEATLPDDLVLLAKQYLVATGDPEAAARIASNLRRFRTTYGEDPLLAQVVGLYAYQEAIGKKKVSWSKVEALWQRRHPPTAAKAI